MLVGFPGQIDAGGDVRVRPCVAEELILLPGGEPPGAEAMLRARVGLPTRDIDRPSGVQLGGRGGAQFQFSLEVIGPIPAQNGPAECAAVVPVVVGGQLRLVGVEPADEAGHVGARDRLRASRCGYCETQRSCEDDRMGSHTR